jgi:glycosyltransferase involved in cell wall biosynthesis
VNAEIDTRLWVIGPDPPEEIRALASDSVLVTGHVPRVDDHFRHARVFVSPLRYGAGMKGKIGHAMTYGLPVVTTQIGAEGMDLVDGEHALIREGAEAFAEGVVTLYRDAELWQRLSARSQETVHERWSPEAMRGRLDDLLSKTARRTRVG